MAAKTLRPSPMSTSHFNYSGNVFTAEASSLPNRGQFGRVYKDACDVGLTLVSSRTGAEIVFEVVEEKVVDGDLQYWTLRPVGRTHPFAVVIFND